MIGPHSIVELEHHPRLRLILTPYKECGYSYEWQDGHGSVFSAGYCEGSLDETREMACLRGGFTSTFP